MSHSKWRWHRCPKCHKHAKFRPNNKGMCRKCKKGSKAAETEKKKEKR